MDAVNTAPAPSLTDLARRINIEHKEACAALARSLHHAMTAGDLLIEAKARVPHGGWLPWLKANCEIPERTVQLYTRLAKNRQTIEARVSGMRFRNSVADFSIRNALRLLAPPKAEPEGPEPLANSGEREGEDVNQEAPVVDMAPAAEASLDMPELAPEQVAAIGEEASVELARAEADAAHALQQQEALQELVEDSIKTKIKAEARVIKWRRIAELLHRLGEPPGGKKRMAQTCGPMPCLTRTSSPPSPAARSRCPHRAWRRSCACPCHPAPGRHEYPSRWPDRSLRGRGPCRSSSPAPGRRGCAAG